MKTDLFVMSQTIL